MVFDIETLALSAVSVALLAFVVFKILKPSAAKQDPILAQLQQAVASLQQGVDAIGRQIAESAKPAPAPTPSPTTAPGEIPLSLEQPGTTTPTSPSTPSAMEPGQTYKYVWDPVTRKHKLVPSK